MSTARPNTGIEILDLGTFQAFRDRTPRMPVMETQLEAMRRMARLLASDSTQLLQELVDTAIVLCNADSAGVSLETVSHDGKPSFHWVVTAGEYSKFAQAMLPREWMPCAICIETMRPQYVRVPQTHFAAMGIEAMPITEGILIPWNADGQLGTIWILAHGRTEAFDSSDLRVMETFSDLAAMAVRNQMQQKIQLERARHSAATAKANSLAHRINNPLQSITNSLYLAAMDQQSEYLEQAARDLKTLSMNVRHLLLAPEPPK